jgi:hypothetical protein
MRAGRLFAVPGPRWIFLRTLHDPTSQIKEDKRLQLVVVVMVVVFIYPDLSPWGYAGYHNYLYLCA